MKSIQTLTQNMTGFRQAAESGSFAISEEGSKAYVAAIDEALLSLQEQSRNLHVLQQKVRLGTSPDAVAITQYNLENATGGSGTIGIVPAIEQLITALDEAKTAVQKAVENYQSTDHQHQHNFNTQ